MSILFPRNHHWLANNWVSFAFFEDCLPFLDQASQLRTNIEFCLAAEVDTLDLREGSIQVISSVKMLVEQVRKRYYDRDVKNSYSLEQLTIYLSKLEELYSRVDEVLDIDRQNLHRDSRHLKDA